MDLQIPVNAQNQKDSGLSKADKKGIGFGSQQYFESIQMNLSLSNESVPSVILSSYHENDNNDVARIEGL